MDEKITSPVALHGLLLFGESWIDLRFVLPAFDVDVRLHRLENRACPLVFAQRDVVHARQLGEIVQPEILRDVRALVTFHDGVVPAHCDDEDITEAASESQVANVTGMNDVEATVALNDRLAFLAKSRPLDPEALDRMDLLVRLGATHGFDSIRSGCRSARPCRTVRARGSLGGSRFDAPVPRCVAIAD